MPDTVQQMMDPDDASLKPSSVESAMIMTQQEDFSRSDLSTEAAEARTVASSAAEVLITTLVCPLCSRPLQIARSVPCGNSICDECWDAAPLDGEMKQCPFTNCVKGRHWVKTSHDYTLSKIWNLILGQAGGALSSTNSSNLTSALRIFQDVVKSALLGPREHLAKVVDSCSSLEDDDYQKRLSGFRREDSIPVALLSNILSELDCQICYSLLYDPLTTPCGHTFCRTCLLRAIDHSPLCPTCRSPMPPPFANIFHAPRNERLSNLFLTFWPEQWVDRKNTITEDNDPFTEFFQSEDATRIGPGITVPIFVCTLSFPYMPTFLHIFEPRYKLMIRRCMESDHRFGICLPKSETRETNPGEDSECPTSQYGTILRIHNVQYLEDGRSLVETHGEDRYRLERWGIRDGYMVGRVELLADDGTDGDTEDAEISSLYSASALGIDLSEDESDLSVEDLLKEATEFIDQLRKGSAPWLLQRVELTHGEVPRDPTVFAFWVASLIPVDEDEKYLLLKARGVRTRLRIVIHWIRKLQTQWWFNGGCLVM